jgi:dihydrofolate reductase
MSKIQLYIASSIDGYIAKEDDSIDWLTELPNPNGIDHGYHDFISNVDTVIMGRKTYDEILGFGVEWPYANCKSYVVSKNEDYQIKTENTSLISSIHESTIKGLKKDSTKNIWIIGGGELITHFMNINAIDEMMICIIPIVIGKGKQLFPNQPKETNFILQKSEVFETGAVMLTYLHK